MGARPPRPGALLLLVGALAWGSAAAAAQGSGAAPEQEVSGPTPVAPEDIEEGTQRALEVGPPAGVAWAAHGAVAALPVVGVYLTARATGDGPWRPLATSAAGALLGLLPARLAYAYSNPTEARWRELDVALLMLSLLLTPPLAGLGSWGASEWLLGGSVHPGRAYLGAMAGAAAGHLSGLLLNGLLVRLFPDPEPDLGGFRLGIAAGLLGVGAGLGQRWLGGGPRRR